MDTPTLARAARQLLRSSEAGVLELAASTGATPFVLSHEGRPVLPRVVGAAPGTLAALRAEPRAAGDVSRVAIRGLLRAATAPEAARLAAFVATDGALALEPQAVEVSGPFGRAELPAAALLLAEPAWRSEEAGILEHMNEDHEDSMLNMCRHYFGHEAASARLLAVDPEGLHVRTEGGTFYFPFDQRCDSHEDVHQATVRLARTARLALAGGAG
jgi:hypothetical protein